MATTRASLSVWECQVEEGGKEWMLKGNQEHKHDHILGSFSSPPKTQNVLRSKAGYTKATLADGEPKIGTQLWERINAIT